MSVDLIILVCLILGLAFMALEAFAPAFGVLGMMGIVSFITAIVMLMDKTHFYGIEINVPILVGIGIVGVAIVGVSAYVTWRTRKARISAGAEMMQGMVARVIEWNDDAGRVHIDGEAWQAKGPDMLVIGDTVEVVGRDNLVLMVKKAD